MKRIKFLLIGTFVVGAMLVISCKKERTCSCELSYFIDETETRIIPIGKATFKHGQDKCNNESTKIVDAEAGNPTGIKRVTCVVK